jgi:hypothetical protein
MRPTASITNFAVIRIVHLLADPAAANFHLQLA